MESQDSQSDGQSQNPPCSTLPEDIRSQFGGFVYTKLKAARDELKPGRYHNALPLLNEALPFLMHESLERQEQIAAQVKEYLISLQSVSAEMKDTLAKMHGHSRLTIWLTIALLIATVAIIAQPFAMRWLHIG
jgi:hypothetical protein